jgi:hypothetical protein
MRDFADYEGTLAAARRLLDAGPFWVLDLWESLPRRMQEELVNTLADCESFHDAVAASGLCDFEFELSDWLEEQGLDRQMVEGLARFVRDVAGTASAQAAADYRRAKQEERKRRARVMRVVPGSTTAPPPSGEG